MQKSCLLLLIALALSPPASAASFVAGTWYHITISSNNDAVPASSDPGMTPLFLSPGAAPWTFSLIGPRSIEVVDAGLDGDSIAVFDIAANNARTQIGFQ